jgi:hypothetical protein
MLIARRVALDTNYARFAPIGALEALVRRGFLLSLPIGVFEEWWAGTIARDSGGDEFHRFRNRVARLVPLLDSRWPLLPDSATLTKVLRASRSRGAKIRRDRSELARRRLMGVVGAGLTPEMWRSVGSLARDQIDQEAAFFMSAVTVARALDPQVLPTSEKEAVDIQKRIMAIRSGFGHCLARCDAFFSVFTLRALRSLVEKRGQHGRIEPNDMEDHSLLLNIAWPTIIATSDIRLIRAVDESGTFQSPWVRTLSELLTTYLGLETPWGRDAKRRGRRFVRPQTYTDLKRRDDEVLSTFRERRPDER